MILVLRALGIGELATGVPALRGLRSAFPGRTLALAAPAWLAPLVNLVEVVDRLVPVDGLAPRRVPVRPPYWAVNLHGRGPQSHRLLQATDPVTLCAFTCPEAGHLDGPTWREEEPEVERWCRLLGWYGIRADPEDRSLLRPRPGRIPTGAVIVHPGAKDPAGRWPLRRFVEVARALAEPGHRVLVTGSPAEAPLATELARRAGLPPSAVLAGAIGVGELAEAVAHARLVVSGDTGVAHLATAYRTRSVVLFGAMSPHRWGPPAQRWEHRALWHGELADKPGNGGPPPGLLAITVKEVLAATDEVIARAR
jgi:ADP-heptose:LPS heptosyltransferase